MKKFVFITVVFLCLSSGIRSEECPVGDYDDVIVFCTGTNSLGLTFPVSTDKRSFDYVYEEYNMIQEDTILGGLMIRPKYVEDFNEAYFRECACFGTYPVDVTRWLVMRVGDDGDLNLSLSHSDNEDIDYVCWGPFKGKNKKEMLDNVCADVKGSLSFTAQYDRPSAEEIESCPYLKRVYEIDDSLQNVMNVMGNSLSKSDIINMSLERDNMISALYEEAFMYDANSPCYRGKFDNYPYKKLVDCSFSTLGVETCIIPNAKKGDWYLFLVNNFSQMEGDLTVEKVAGTASIDCSSIIDISNSGPYCEGETIELTLVNAPKGATFSWTGPDGFSSTLQNPKIENATVANAGVYTFQMTANGVASDVVTTEVEVFKTEKRDSSIRLGWGETATYGGKTISAQGVYTLPLEYGCGTMTLNVVADTQKLKIECETPICEGEELRLSVSKKLADFSAKWYGPNGFFAEGWETSLPDVKKENEGMYELRLVDTSGSETMMDSVRIRIGQKYAVDTLIMSSFDEPVTYDGVIYSSDNILKYELKSADGCDSLVTVRIVFDCEFAPAEFFTPNGDGENDTWQINNIGCVEDVEVKIFDRAGKLLRHFPRYSNESGWDGTDEAGNKLPSTDYWFTINSTSKDILISGHVTLIR